MKKLFRNRTLVSQENENKWIYIRKGFEKFSADMQETTFIYLFF